MTVAIPEKPPQRGPRFYDTYNTSYINPPPPPDGGSDSGDMYTPRNLRGPAGPQWVNRLWNNVPAQPNRVSLPKQVPGWLGDRRLLVNAWLGAMAIVIVDEWWGYGVMPRPKRLWYTTMTYFILMFGSIADPLVPFVNIYALGLLVVLAYQYFNGTGQFVPPTKPVTE